MIIGRQYYSERTGRNKFVKIDLPQLKTIFQTIYGLLSEKKYFIENYGYYDDTDYHNFHAGKLGSETNVNDYLFLKLRKENLWPIYSNINNYSEDDLFDVIEFCFDNISKPIYNTNNRYDAKAAQDEFRDMLNPHLKDYANGFTLNEKGCITINPEYGLEQIFEANVCSEDDNITSRLEYAVEKFRNRNSSFEDRREAVRNLAEILEYLRPAIKKNMFHKDESDLFNIANNFNIRHHKDLQKTDYDGIWLNWIFYLYLSTIHAMTRTIKRLEEKRDV